MMILVTLYIPGCGILPGKLYSPSIMIQRIMPSIYRGNKKNPTLATIKIIQLGKNNIPSNPAKV